MSGRALIRPLSSVAWDLRSAWAGGWRIALSLERADVDRVEGCVSHVAATAATATVAGVLVPLDRVLAVHRPSRLGDSTFKDGHGVWARGPRSGLRPQAEELFA